MIKSEYLDLIKEAYLHRWEMDDINRCGAYGEIWMAKGGWLCQALGHNLSEQEWVTVGMLALRIPRALTYASRDLF